jgi:hypothetical protein
LTIIKIYLVVANRNFPIHVPAIRDMYYRHKAWGALDTRVIARTLAAAEWKFIILSGALYTAVFVPLMGLQVQVIKEEDGTYEPIDYGWKFFTGLWMWALFTLNVGIYSYAGQMFACLVKGGATAQVLATVFIGINTTYAGLIARPYMIGE